MILQKIRSVTAKISHYVSYAALVPLFAMVFVVAVDVILRKTIQRGINGSNELTTYFMVWICMLGIPVLHAKDGHVWVSLFVNKFPFRFRCFWRAVIMVFETVIIGFLAYGGYAKTIAFIDRSTVTDVLKIPRWIFALAGLIAFLEYFIMSFADTLQLFIDGASGVERVREEGWSDDEVKGI